MHLERLFRRRLLLSTPGTYSRHFNASVPGALLNRRKGEPKNVALEDDIRLEDDRIKLPWQNVEGTTITHREREVFERLFQNVVRDAAIKKPTLAKTAKSTSLKQSDPQTVRSRKELADSVSQFPEALRDIALNTAEKIERNAWQARYDKENETIALSVEAQQQAAEAKSHQEKELGRLRLAMKQADSDLAVWNLLEDDLFSKFANLHVQEATNKQVEHSAPNISSGMDTDSFASVSPASVTDVLRFGILYPAALNEALHAWRERFPTSTMPLSVVPRMKQLGRASYALGASASLYHQIIQVTWALTGDFLQVTKLLQEMDDAGIDFDDNTLVIVLQIQEHWQNMSKSASSKTAAAAFRLDMIADAYDTFRKWRSVVETRLDASALRQANHKIAEHVI